MQGSRSFRAWLLAAACALSWGLAHAQSADPAARDGSHDFDFNLGVWHTDIVRTPDPFSAPSQTVAMSGTVTVRKVWDGRAQIEEIEVDGPSGHWQGLTLFIYNPQSRQWTQAFSNSAEGSFSGAAIGSFANGRGELYQQDTFKGRSILVRGTWSQIEPASHRYEEAYSDDGGRTWKIAFNGKLTKADPAAAAQAEKAAQLSAERDANHDFDFDIGTWKTHSRRLLRPLTGSSEWVELDGVTRVSKVWGGRANLAEVRLQGATGPAVELLSLRMYNPQSHQWSLNFANPKAGSLGVPNVGQFVNGRGDFYDYEEINGKFVFVRFSIWPEGKDTGHSEQAFSTDGGRTWEVNWVTTYTRMADEVH
jgi:hypothetical protein